MNIATYRDVEIRLTHLADGTVWVEVCLLSGKRTFECRSDATAMSMAKIMVDKDRLGLLDSASD
jgi:hypothetical protein